MSNLDAYFKGLLMERSQSGQNQQHEVPQEQIDLLSSVVQATKQVCNNASIDPGGPLATVVFDNILRMHRSFKMERVSKEFEKKMAEVRGPTQQPLMPMGSAGPGNFYDRL